MWRGPRRRAGHGAVSPGPDGTTSRRSRCTADRSFLLIPRRPRCRTRPRCSSGPPWMPRVTAPPQSTTVARTLPAMSILHVGPCEFDHVSCDLRGDALHLRRRERQAAADTVGSAEGDPVRLDSDGQVMGLTIVNAKWLLERDDDRGWRLAPLDGPLDRNGGQRVGVLAAGAEAPRAGKPRAPSIPRVLVSLPPAASRDGEDEAAETERPGLTIRVQDLERTVGIQRRVDPQGSASPPRHSVPESVGASVSRYPARRALPTASPVCAGEVSVLLGSTPTSSPKPMSSCPVGEGSNESRGPPGLSPGEGASSAARSRCAAPCLML